ncbi:MAG: SDR family oxidoreductase [Gammaproteobacteria bacterium]
MILITGATGNNGAELVKLFAARNIPVRAMVRDASRAAAISFPGVEIVEGDFSAPETLGAALAGVERAFLLTPSSEQAEEQQIDFVDAARKSGVAHVVKLSQLGADANSSARFLRYHAAVEQFLQSSGMTYTFLRPNLYMQGLLNFKSTITAQNAFYAAAGDGRVSVIDVRDIAEVAFAALTQSGHEDKIYDLTGPQALTHAEMAEQLSTAIGRDVRFVDVSSEAMRKALLEVGLPAWQADGLVEEYALWSQDEAASISSDGETVLGRELRSFSEFARDYASAFG